MIVVVSSLYAYVLYVHEDQLERRYPNLVKNSSFYDYVGHTPQLSPPSGWLSFGPQTYA